MNCTTQGRMFSGLGILLSIGLLVLFTTGCGPSKKELLAKGQVDRARKALADARGNPGVDAYAPIQLQDATKAFQAAEKAEELDDMIHLGYIAERKSMLAMTVADAKAAEREMDKLNVEKAELFAQKQSLEAEQARKEADKALSQALQARKDASAEAERAAIAKRQADEARQQAEMAKRQADQAKQQMDQAKQQADQARQQMDQAKQQAEQARLAAQAEAEKAAKAKAEADQLMKEVADLKAQQTERGIVLTIGDVLFATGKANLSEKANVSVGKLAAFLSKYPNRNVLIEGHTDSVGSDEYNMVLSGKRADSVKYELVKDGVDAGRITTVGYGEKFPMASNDTSQGKSQNRRVEVVILNEGVQADTQFRK